MARTSLSQSAGAVLSRGEAEIGITEEAGKVGTAAVSAMAGTPLAIALLLVNVGFLGFAGFVLGEVAANASERNKSQMDLIEKLVHDIRDCRQGPKPTVWPMIYPPSFTDIDVTGLPQVPAAH